MGDAERWMAWGACPFPENSRRQFHLLMPPLPVHQLPCLQVSQNWGVIAEVVGGQVVQTRVGAVGVTHSPDAPC